MKVLFLSVTAGQGHHQVALALQNYFEMIEKAECQTLDVFDNVNPLLKDSVQNAYLLSTKMTPRMYGLAYDMADRRDATKDSGLGKIIKTVVNKNLMRYLRDYKPDAIVCTHAFAAIALSYLKRKYPIKAKTFGVVTDFTVHPFWEDTELDYYVTASSILDFQMIQKGIGKRKILPFGIPILPKFALKAEKEDARHSLAIENEFTVLVMMGSMGYGNDTFEMIKELDLSRGDIQLIVVCGNNKKLKRQIESYPSRNNIICYGYTNQVDKLMDAADCIITKPGGLSTSEALAKNLPMIMLDPIPGQEDRNKEFLLNNGLALSLSDTFTVSEAIYLLKNHPERIKSLKENMEHIAKPESTKNLAEFIVSVCGN